jgi:peptidoglycan hydrolase-like protein with peptidoglycan-binding domain
MRVNSAGKPSLYVGAAALAFALSLSACTSGGDDDAERAAADRPATSSSSTSVTSTTLAPTTTAAPTTTVATTAPPPPPGLRTGSRGEEVRALEQRLTELRFDTGSVDGVYDGSTMHAVMAFQKAYGMARTGRATPDVIERVASAPLQTEMVPGGGRTKVEVDLKRQVLTLWKDGSLFRVIDVSTGSGQRYCVDGECAKAVTPGGSFKVTRRISGWRTSRLGRLYNPLYFNGGIAIHGAPSVPAYPASHGCVRIPMYVSGWFPGQVPNGTPVYVLGGPTAPVPFNEPAPGDTAPDSSTTTTPGATTTTTSPDTSTSTTSTTSPSSSTTTTTGPSSTTTTAPSPAPSLP